MTSSRKDQEQALTIPGKDFKLEGNLHLPKNTTSIVLFVHGSGSSRFSSRNQQVARVLQEAKISTLLFDLLTAEEEKIDLQTRELRFNIDLLTSRLLGVSDWIKQNPLTEKLALGYFGASTGGAAAIAAAAQRPQEVKAVVSRGGRPDLARTALAKIQVPTLLIVGGNDPVVIDLNKQAMTSMQNIHKLEIVPKATHLFEETGALEIVAQLAKEWFLSYLTLK